MAVAADIKKKLVFENAGMLQRYVLDPSNYKPCRMKMYTMWACVAGRNGTVANSYFRRDTMYSTVSKVDSSKPVVVCGIGGAAEVTAISIKTLCEHFVLANGAPITLSYLQSWKTGVGGNWIQVKYKISDVKYCAVCVPSNYPCDLKIGGTFCSVNIKTPERDLISRSALGDFIVCPMYHNESIFNQAFVVQGDLFLALFDNHGWTGYIKDKKKIKKSPVMPTSLTFIQ